MSKARSRFLFMDTEYFLLGLDSILFSCINLEIESRTWFKCLCLDLCKLLKIITGSRVLKLDVFEKPRKYVYHLKVKNVLYLKKKLCF